MTTSHTARRRPGGPDGSRCGSQAFRGNVQRARLGGRAGRRAKGWRAPRRRISAHGRRRPAAVAAFGCEAGRGNVRARSCAYRSPFPRRCGKRIAGGKAPAKLKRPVVRGLPAGGSAISRPNCPHHPGLEVREHTLRAHGHHGSSSRIRELIVRLRCLPIHRLAAPPARADGPDAPTVCSRAACSRKDRRVGAVGSTLRSAAV